MKFTTPPNTTKYLQNLTNNGQTRNKRNRREPGRKKHHKRGLRRNNKRRRAKDPPNNRLSLYLHEKITQKMLGMQGHKACNAYTKPRSTLYLEHFRFPNHSPAEIQASPRRRGRMVHRRLRNNNKRVPKHKAVSARRLFTAQSLASNRRQGPEHPRKRR